MGYARAKTLSLIILITRPKKLGEGVFCLEIRKIIRDTLQSYYAYDT